MAKLLSQITGSDLPDPKGFSMEDDSTVFTLSQSISILTSSVDIIPEGNRDLGSSSNGWANVHIGEVLHLSPQETLTTGNIGDLAVSGSNLYFYNGTWTQII
jgi:hypothetical protein